MQQNLTCERWQNYNNELVKCVDDLKEKREEVNKAILKDVRRGAAGVERQRRAEGGAAQPARRGARRTDLTLGVCFRRRKRKTRSRTICEF